MRVLAERVREHKAGRAVGMYSLCSAHPLVIEAALLEGRTQGQDVLIEATCNQVNQFGGYTGMRPADFRDAVQERARQLGVGAGSIALGGDHLGPNCWQGEPAASAMGKAADMVREYVQAGFRKIHLDCSMSCADDPRPLPESVVARRAAQLCAAAEQAQAVAGGESPCYVIGTEVPVPGGAQEDLQELRVTRPSDAAATLDAHRAEFRSSGLDAAWDRVVGLVVQPGVEFDHHKVLDYAPAKAAQLSAYIESVPGIVYEAHSTDYQTPAMLARLVRDHFAILKVGPAATFALRQAYWGLADIERELLGAGRGSEIKDVVLRAMRHDPVHWRSHYRDSGREGFDLQFSLSDRIRYYWQVPEVRAACAALADNLGREPIPLTLLSQYLPEQYAAVRERGLPARVPDLLREAVACALRPYLRAVSLGGGSLP